MNKGKKIVHTPIGTAVYPHLNEADTRFNAAGVFSVDVKFDSNNQEVQEFVEKIKEAADGGRVPIKNDDEGNVVIKFKSKFKPKAFDANGNLMPENIWITNGSLLKLACVINSYDSGIAKGSNLYLKGVQVVELAKTEGSPNGPGNFGFTAIDKEEAPSEDDSESQNSAEVVEEDLLDDLDVDDDSEVDDEEIPF